MRELIRSPNCVVTRSSSYANRANLSPAYFDDIIKKHEGTRLGRQELMGEILEEAEGALWSREMVEKARDGRHSQNVRVLVAVDPAISNTPSSSLTGIIVAARGLDERAYVIADLSGRYSPSEWASVVVGAVKQYGADCIVAEGNQGGDLVRLTIQTVDKNANVEIVHASRSKQATCAADAVLGGVANPTLQDSAGDASDRRPRNDRRAAHGNGTASSAVAPSERIPAHRSNIREWYYPPGPNSWPVNIQPEMLRMAEDCERFAKWVEDRALRHLPKN